MMLGGSYLAPAGITAGPGTCSDPRPGPPTVQLSEVRTIPDESRYQPKMGKIYEQQGSTDGTKRARGSQDLYAEFDSASG